MMKKYRIITKLLCGVMLLCGMAFVYGCKQKPSGNEEEEVICACPPVIYLQPYGNYTQKEAAKLGKELGKRIWDWFGVDMDCEVLPALPLSEG